MAQDDDLLAAFHGVGNRWVVRLLLFQVMNRASLLQDADQSLRRFLRTLMKNWPVLLPRHQNDRDTLRQGCHLDGAVHQQYGEVRSIAHAVFSISLPHPAFVLGAEAIPYLYGPGESRYGHLGERDSESSVRFIVPILPSW
jgi:hypothetical protein